MMAENTTLARPYAQAVFSHAKQQDTLTQWSDILSVLAAILSDDNMAAMLSRPDVNNDALLEIINSVSVQKIQRDFKTEETNFIHLLLENKRLALLPEISEIFEALKIDAQKTIDVVVDTPYPLTEAQQVAMITALEKRFECSVSLASHIDESLIAGVIIRAGDTVIDGSAVGQMNKMSKLIRY